MRVRFITGRAGSGKSRRIFREIKEHLQVQEERHMLLLVPEQFTLQSERDLIQSQHLPGIMEVEVLSFDRLAQRVLSDAGGQTRALIDEQGKHMVLRKVIDDLLPELTVYRQVGKQEGFVRYAANLLSEFKQYQITVEVLNAAENQVDPTLAAKLHDMALIYEHFNHYLGHQYLDMDERVNLVLERIQDASFLQGSMIWLDGFTTFNLQQLDILSQLMLLSEQVTFAFTLDINEKARDGDLFAPARRAYQAVNRIARQLHIFTEHINLLSPEDELNPVLKHLEKELFAHPCRTYAGEADPLTMYAAGNIYQEVEQAAAEIVRLTREKGIRWRDTMVICADMERYGFLIRRTFQEYGIPFFIDIKRDIMTHPLVEYILSLLDLQIKNYRYVDMFRHIKTGLIDLGHDEVEKLENYVLAYGIQGDQWKRDFKQGPEESRAELNQWRQQIMAPILTLEEHLHRASTLGEYTDILYNYLQEQGVADRLKHWTDDLKEQARYEQVYEQTQIWNIVMRIFDQTVDILGAQSGRLFEYYRILEAGFASYQLGIIPTTVDQVMVGSIQHLKSRGVKALLVLGANDGLIPSLVGPEGILLEEERVLLQNQGIALQGGRDRRLEEERYMIYSVFSRAFQTVWISYALADEEGKTLRPSLLADRFKHLFPRMRVDSDVLEEEGEQLRLVGPPSSTFKHLIRQLRLFIDGEPIPKFWWQVARWYQEHPLWQPKLKHARSAFFHNNQVGDLAKPSIKQLYQHPLTTSVSRLEQFAACPFAHLVRYGLRPRERKEYTVELPDIGDLLHQCLYRFSRQVVEQHLDWRQLPARQSEQMVEQIMDDLVVDYGEGVWQSSHRYQYMVDRLKRMGKTTVRAVVDHIQKGRFRPLAFEVQFGPGGQFPPIAVQLADGEVIYLEGRVDRIDILDDEEGRYVKIIDYKTGDQNLSLDEVYYGLSLQLMVYLQAILKNGPLLGKDQLHPAGVFYFHIKDPLVQTVDLIKENVEKELRRLFRMKGLVLKDARLIQQIDYDLRGYSDIIPAAVNSDGSVAKNSAALEAGDWETVLNYVNTVVSQLGHEILQGNAVIEPYRRERNTACTYCPYGSICQFDPLFPDNHYRYLPKYSNEEILNKIRQGEGS